MFVVRDEARHFLRGFRFQPAQPIGKSGLGPAIRNTLRINTASIIRFDFFYLNPFTPIASTHIFQLLKVMHEVEKGHRLPAPLNCPQSLHQLMLECWKKDRNQRPLFAQLCSSLSDLVQESWKLRSNIDHK